MFNKSEVTESDIKLLLDSYEKLILLKEDLNGIGRISDANAIDLAIQNIKQDLNDSLFAFYTDSEPTEEDDEIANELIGTKDYDNDNYVVQEVTPPEKVLYEMDTIPIIEVPKEDIETL